MGLLLPSAVYISYDHGDTFENKTESFVLDDEKKTYARLDQFVSHPKYTSHVVFSDSENKYIFTTKDSGRTFQRIKLSFHPSSISFHDDEPFTFLVHDKINSSLQLWLTKDFGQTWYPVQESVKKFYWSGSNGPAPPSELPNVIPMHGYNYKNNSELQLFIERIEPSGMSTVLSSPSMFQNFQDKTVWITDILEFEVKGDFIFASKPSGKNNVDLYVSYKRGPFVKAVFPSELDRQEYQIPDVSEGQIFVAVSHTGTLANLYTSQSMDEKNIYFALSLERIFCFFPNLTWNDSWLMETEEPFADFHKVEGLKGIYIASQVQPDADSNNIGPEHLLTLITFDRGGEWRPVTPPPLDASGVPINCKLNEGCSLHLSQKFSQLYPSTQSIPILSSKSAPGIIMATGTIGKSLKGHPGVFLSQDGGLTWRQILSNYYFFNFGDYGGVLVAVKYYKSHFKSKELLYSTDEGERFMSHEFHAEELRVYGLMVKPEGDTTVFTMFGSAMGHHQWLIIKVDLKNAFSYKCTPDDYKFWSPGSRTGHKMSCILGRKEVYQRRIPHSNCYNGRDYERPIKIEVCECDAEDFECDFGFERSLTERHCIRNKSFDFNPYKIPATCTPGGFYNRTRGYRKIPGDVCLNGREDLYLPQTLPCPVKEKKEFLLVAQRTQITRIDLKDNSVVKLPIENLTNVITIEFDMRNNCVYWADMRHEVIGRQCLASGTSKPEILVMHNITSIEGMALDWVSNNLYFVDGVRVKIEVIRTDIQIQGRMRRTILDKRVIKKPRGIAVHPMQGYLFWTDWAGNESCVSRANLDGSNVKKLFAYPVVQWPNGVTIDYIAQRIYWVDAKLDYIASANLDGKQFKKILQNEEIVRHPFSVAVFKDNMYWDDWRIDCIFIADKDHGVDIQPILRNSSGLMDLKIFAHSFQEGTNPCGSPSTNKCSHLCMGGPGGTHTCLCPDNMIMEDGVCYCPGKMEPDASGACPSVGHTCSPDSFMCANSLCIPYAWVCNDENDCGDNSDEVNCNKDCSEGMFSCSYGQCYPLNWKCDYEKDCSDGSDEENCHYQNGTCKPDDFRCDNGRCISKHLLCDTQDDCYDGSDEVHCEKNATNVVCKDAEFKCGNNCVQLNWQCDGEVDCPNGEDEKNCTLSCHKWQFQCADKSCIFESWRCDGSPDCEDMSDELNCPPKTENSTIVPPAPPTQENCTGWYFRCQNRKCIPYFWKCDNVDDCGDRSDEIGCPTEETASKPPNGPHETSETCRAHEFRCDSGECIQNSWVCDGMMDCDKGEDEENCKGGIVCKPEQFKCRIDGSCIELDQVCDGVSQCPDNSDENDCSPNKHIPGPAGPSCFPGHFSCDESLCIPLSQLCDGRKDCYDGTDESNCGNITRVYQVLEMKVEQKKSSPTSLLVYWQAPSSQNKKFQYLPSIAEIQKQTQTWNNMSWIDNLEYRFRGLKPFTNYNMTVYVRVANTVVVFPPAKYITAWTSEEVPSPPMNVKVVQKSYKSVEVSWLPPVTPNGPITTYIVQVSPPYPALTKKVSGSITSITLESDFSENENYTFWVLAANDNFRSEPSKQAILKFDSSSNIQAVQNLTAEKVDEKSIKLSWKPVPNVDGYSIQTVVPYDERYPSLPTVNASKDASSVIITNLAPMVRYKFEINAFRKEYPGPKTSVTFLIDGTALPPISVKSAELVKDEGTTVMLSWSPPQTTLKQKWVYGIYYSVRAVELFQGAKLTTTNLSITIPNLAACETYLFDVGLVGPSGVGPLAPPFERTTSYNKNAPPKNLQVKTNPDNENEMIVLWESSCKMVAEPIGYEVKVTELNLNKSSSVTLAPTAQTQFRHTFRSHYGGVYSVRVSTTAPKAIPSEPVRYEAPEILPPHQVQILSESNGSPVLMWKERILPKAVQDSGYKYKVFVSEGGDLNVSIAKQYVTDSPRFTFKDIKEGVMYSFAVMLVTEDGYSSKLSEVKSYQTSEISDFLSSTNFVSILVPIMILSIALLIVLGFFIYRQKRLKRRFFKYANSHYDTRSGSTTFGGADDLDDEDSPNIRGFSDDEPLVMA
ncbi:UNVERIFIED_CONTAM: hypothetical protein PYX00_009183 [Menopon gallinae]